jgi:hypothetical protein
VTKRLVGLPRCRVCKKQVTPENAVEFGAFGRFLFVAHKDSCADVVREGTRLAGKLTRTLLEKRRPALAKKLKEGAELTDKLVRLLKG